MLTLRSDKLFKNEIGLIKISNYNIDFCFIDNFCSCFLYKQWAIELGLLYNHMGKGLMQN